MNLSLDSMDILKIVLLIFEAVLLTDCRGELLHICFIFHSHGVINQGWFPHERVESLNWVLMLSLRGGRDGKVKTKKKKGKRKYLNTAQSQHRAAE